MPADDAGVTFAEFLDHGAWLATSRAGQLALTPTSASASAKGFVVAHPRRVVAAVQSDPDTVVTTAASGVTTEWDLRTGAAKVRSAWAVPNGVTTSATRTRDGVTVLCGLDGAAMVRRDGVQLSPRGLDAGRTCADVDLSSDELFLATGHSEGSVRVWSFTGQPFSARLPMAAPATLVSFLSDTRYLLAVDTSGVIRVWISAPAARYPRVGLAYTWTSAFSPDGQRLAMASGTSTTTPGGIGVVVDARTMTPLTPPLRHAINVRSVAFSPDGALVATVAENGTARLWNSQTGEPVTDELPHQRGGYQVRFAADGRFVVVESYADAGGAPRSGACREGNWSRVSRRRVRDCFQTSVRMESTFSSPNLPTASGPAPRWHGRAGRRLDWLRVSPVPGPAHHCCGRRIRHRAACDGRPRARNAASIRCGRTPPLHVGG